MRPAFMTEPVITELSLSTIPPILHSTQLNKCAVNYTKRKICTIILCAITQ